jgi:paired amphipathic helix protein Sin3a
MGTHLTSMQPRPGPPQVEPLGLAGPSLQQLHERGNQMWQQPLPVQHRETLSPNGRIAGPGIFNQQNAQGPSHDSQMDYQPSEQANSAAALAHQQEQRGVSQLQNAVSAATNGTPSRPTTMQASPGATQAPSLAQPGPGLSGLNSGAITPGQVGLEKRGPVEFNHAISYVNKIKVRDMKCPPKTQRTMKVVVGDLRTDLVQYRIDSQPSRRSTSNFLRSSKLTSESQSRFKMSMLKLPSSLAPLLIF